jgi:hypothetical protein
MVLIVAQQAKVSHEAGEALMVLTAVPECCWSDGCSRRQFFNNVLCLSDGATMVERLFLDG